MVRQQIRQIKGLPLWSKLKKKSKKPVIEPVLNLPDGLDLRTIREYKNIPDSYVKKHFPLDEFRAKKFSYNGSFSLFDAMFEHLIGYQTPPARPRLRYNYDDDDVIEDSVKVKLSVDQLKEALTHILESPTLSLFDTVELESYNTRAYNGYSKKVNTVNLLKKEEILESDAVVIVKIKKKIFTEILRYRRAKKGL